MTRLEATLLKGKRTIAKAKRGKTTRTATLALKSERLKKGTYSLRVWATDGMTSTIKTVRVRVGR